MAERVTGGWLAQAGGAHRDRELALHQARVNVGAAALAARAVRAHPARGK